MDKNKCPIFIFKKEFQKMKIVFFWHFFSDQKSIFYYDEWWHDFVRKWSWDHKLFSEKNAFFPIFSTFFWKLKIFLRTVLSPKKRASQLFSTFFLNSKHLQSQIFFWEKKVIFFSKKSSALDRTINSPYALNHSFFFSTSYRLASQNARFFWTARLCSHHSFFLNRLTMNAAKLLVFFERCAKIKWKNAGKS